MAFCSNCGASVPGEARFCPACGQPVAAAASQAVTAVPETAHQEDRVPRERYEAPQQSQASQQNSYAPQATQQSYYAPQQSQAPQQSYYAPQQPQPQQQSYYAPQQSQPQQQSYYAQQQPQSQQQSYYAQQQNNYGYQQKPSYQAGPADVEENKGICVLSYLGILFLIPLLTKPNSSYVRFHCNQGLLLCLLAVGISIVTWIFLYISFVLSAIISWVGWIFVLVLAIMGIVNTVHGQMKPLPLIGKYTLIK